MGIKIRIVGLVGRATACNRRVVGLIPAGGFDRGVAMDFCLKQSGWLINELGNPAHGCLGKG